MYALLHGRPFNTYKQQLKKTKNSWQKTLIFLRIVVYLVIEWELDSPRDSLIANTGRAANNQ